MDPTRIAALVDYVEEYADCLDVALRCGNAEALPESDADVTESGFASPRSDFPRRPTVVRRRTLAPVMRISSRYDSKLSNSRGSIRYI